MAHVVTDACVRCRYTDCVSVCPVDCFRALPEMLLIDGDACIDCGLCVDECPVRAIFHEDDVPAALEPWVAFNRRHAPAAPPLTEKVPPHPEAAAMREVTGKLHLVALPG
jgi:ferredoxin